MIVLDHLVKHYKVHARPPGLAAALRSLVRRKYSTVKAVDDISFRIEAGERVGFLGPNGAGKTTTLKVLSGLLVPTSGKVTVHGFVPNERRHDFLKSIMLVAGQKSQLLWDLPPADTFDLNRAIYGVSHTDFQSRLKELVELLDIGLVVNKPTRQLSLGERMKCELAAALLHQPSVLFLDEPTIGLDVTMQAVVRRFIKTYNERYEATILLTSHNMDDVAAICDRIIIIDHGRILFDGPLTELVRTMRPEKRLTLHFSQPVNEARVTGLGRLVERTDVRAVVQVPQTSLQGAVQAALRDLPIADLSAEDPPLEEILADLFQSSRAARATS